MKLAESILNDINLFLKVDEEKDDEKKCPFCGSTDVSDTEGKKKCNSCGKDLPKEDEEEMEEENESLTTLIEAFLNFDEGKKTADTQLNKAGWKYDDESKSYKHPDFPGHEIVNWKKHLHHLKDNEHVATLTHWGKDNPHDDLTKHLRATFGKEKK